MNLGTPGFICSDLYFPRNISKQVANLTRIVALALLETRIGSETASLASWDASCKPASQSQKHFDIFVDALA